MFNQIKSWQVNRTLKKQLLSLLNEMEKNLEIYYVMDQRQFIIHGYMMKQWENSKDLDIVKKHEAIKVYGAALSAFNQAHLEHKEYEQWYSSNMDHKTPDNAKKLHDMKNGVVARIKTLEAIIIPAGQTLEKELLNLGFITN
jgi:hypothetical protein